MTCVYPDCDNEIDREAGGWIYCNDHYILRYASILKRLVKEREE